jgi:signal transduction histidine kinase
LNQILHDQKLDEAQTKQIRAIRGLCRKANRVARSAGLFTLFRFDQPIHLRQIRLTRDKLLEMIIECARDNEILISPERQIQILIDQTSFEEIPELTADLDWIQLAINNLLDNATKYSFSQSTVSISARQQKNTFQIIVTNFGIRIHPEEVSKCLQRGWRGNLATEVTSEGSGLGLWVVDQIMKAHKGSIEVSPSDPVGQTKVRLVFYL